MFIRKVKNRSGSQSVQVIQKFRGKNKVVKTIGCATTQHEIERLEQLVREEMNRYKIIVETFIFYIFRYLITGLCPKLHLLFCLETKK